MPLEVKKQDRETAQGLIRRFTKRVQRSGVLFQARRNRFRKRLKSKQMRKKSTLRKEQIKIQYQRLKKLGISKD